MQQIIRFKKFLLCLLLLPLILYTNPIYAAHPDIQIDWMIEGQLNSGLQTSSNQIISNYENIIEEQKKESEKVYYDKFVTGNGYSIGDHAITIESEEGQILNKVLIDQRDLSEENWLHKIKYHDRYSDGYVEVAEALLDPVGEQRYIIRGVAFDYYPNSNLELFLLERGYDLDDLEAIPNGVFSPAALDKAREIIANSQKYGGEFDLNELSPNYLRLDQTQMRERMIEDLTAQSQQIFEELLTGKKLQPDGSLKELEVMVSTPQDTRSRIFDNLKLERPQFENTKHIRDALNERPIFELQPTTSIDNYVILIMIPVVVALIVLGYLMHKKPWERKLEAPLLQTVSTQVDFKKQTAVMLDESISLFNGGQRKDAYEKLSQAIRYYYCNRFGITYEMTSIELISIIRKSNIAESDAVQQWLMHCASVEFAKLEPSMTRFNDITSNFAHLIK
ncbi:MAG: hypothetical protein DWQ19_06445 [Crenarchaeota archaeon]|nr:MAG: hypothetical protein DWQ17_00910 [Thermoproteota archaeon]RDJ36248.1 MAG: hypothetical protein DWQ19_06445 [Thermoproteota archaeon]